jgi:hypothetical protein
MALTVTEKRLAHLQRVLLHQEKLAAGSWPPERPSSQLRIPLLCEVRPAAEAAAKSKSRRSRRPAQSELQL